LFKQNNPQSTAVCRKGRNTWKKALNVQREDQALGSAKQEGAVKAGDGTETVCKRLRQNNLNACSPRKVPLLTVKHVAKRIEYAKIHKDWSVEKCRNILWSDKSKIVLFGGKGSRSYVRRPPRTEYNPRLHL